MAPCEAWLRGLKQQSNFQLMGMATFGWAVVCLICIGCYTASPDKSSLPSLLLVMVFGSLIMVTVFRILISDQCKRRNEHLEEHIWASMSFELVDAVAPKFHRIQIRTAETPKGKVQSTTSVLEEVPVLCPPKCKQHTCVSCLEDFNGEDKVSILPCGHIFHESCHVDWHLHKQSCGSACPICRDSWAIV